MHSLKKRRAALERDELTEAARDAAKRDALRALRLKTVIRENHGAARTTRVEFARGSARTSNLYATCGGSAVTVYDDAHFGDHTAIVAQYAHETTAMLMKGPYARINALKGPCRLYKHSKTMSQNILKRFQQKYSKHMPKTCSMIFD